MDAALRDFCAQLARQRQLSVQVDQVVYFPPQPFTPELVEGVRSDAAALGFSAMDVVSGAGHDAVYLARVAPTAMVFVPCAGGISHNEIEDARPEHLEAGCNVLLRALLRSAGVVA
jgi:N-carbamoyl-L-amino-acid hydrolase